ncbi:MAG TPA: hypothetical protein VL463_19885 [Kofleriaceae bacterium]|nr:hypothetical protein [Kofleriaceae bacterium]
MTWKLICGALFASALSFACTDQMDSTASAAVSENAGSDHRPPPRPPKEAVDACASLKASDACAFDIDGHHVTGTCKTAPDGNGPLACAPDQPPPPPKPPQEALDACASSAEGDDCTFTVDGHTLDGSCITCPNGSGELACAPPMPPPPQ